MTIAKISKVRTIFPQFIASSAKNCILWTSGIVVSLPTIIIPELTQTENELHFSFYQASWFASMIPLFMIVGTLISGITSELLGRKRAMLIGTTPHIIGITLLYFANSVTMIFIGISVMGLGIGLGESAVATYVAEISQSSIRGILLSMSNIMIHFGSLTIFTLGSLFNWRRVVLYAMIMPYITASIIILVPEAPLWLLSKNRKKDAQRSLRWLRGWAPAENVEEELTEMQENVEISNKCKVCEKNNTACSHPPPTLRKRLLELLRRRNLSVFFIVLMLFFIDYFMGTFAMRPFLLQILRAYRVPIEPHWATVAILAACVLAKILCVATIKFIGKRRMAIWSLSSSMICLMGLAFYAELRLPSNCTSFSAITDDFVQISYIPLVLFILYYFFCNFGMTGIPWMTLCEMFPFKNRCSCTSVAIALGQLINFSATKSYIYLELGLALSGVMWFFAAVCMLGIFLIYFLLPESEGVSMKEMELFFSDNNRKLTDVDIGLFLKKRQEGLNDSSKSIQL